MIKKLTFIILSFSIGAGTGALIGYILIKIFGKI